MWGRVGCWDLWYIQETFMKHSWHSFLKLAVTIWGHQIGTCNLSESWGQGWRGIWRGKLGIENIIIWHGRTKKMRNVTVRFKRRPIWKVLAGDCQCNTRTCIYVKAFVVLPTSFSTEDYFIIHELMRIGKV